MIAFAVALYTSTADVRSLAAHASTVWAATGGGVEEIDARSRRGVHLYTTLDGLDCNDVREVRFDGALRARTAGAECRLLAGRFSCVPAPILDPPPPRPARIHHGHRQTARVEAAGVSFVATAGGGVWAGDQKLPPLGTLCGNHVEALAEFRGRIWVGTFDAGLCVREGGAFRRIRTPFRMVNDLLPTRRGLYVASAEGLWLTRDGRRFRLERRVRERGANRLATNGTWLFATTPVALYALRLEGRDVVRRFPRPLGTTAIQSVAVAGRDVWLATEDRGAIRLRHDRFLGFDLARGLSSSWAVDVQPAPDGGAFVLTLRHGMNHVSAKGAISQLKDLDPWGLRLVRDGQGLLVGTQGGAFRIEAGSVTPLSGLPDPRAHSFLRAQGALFVGTEGGLVQLEDEAAGSKPPPAPAAAGRGRRRAPRPSARPGPRRDRPGPPGGSPPDRARTAAGG